MLLFFILIPSCRKDVDEYTLIDTSTEHSSGLVNFLPGELGQLLTPAVPGLVLELQADQACDCEGQLGTNILIPANAFVHETGDPVVGPYEVEIIEALTKGDLVRTNRGTVVDDRLMISSGGVFVKAKRGEEILSLAAGKEIVIELPFNGDPASQYPGLKLYVGQTGEKGFSWQEVADSEVNIGETQSTMANETMYSFNYDSNDWYSCLHPYEASDWIDFSLAVPGSITPENSALFLSFKDHFSVVPIDHYDNSVFSTEIDVPANEEVQLIGIAQIEDELYATSTNLTLSQNVSEAIVFEAMSIDAINELLDALE